MELLPLETDSFGTGEHGPYLADLEERLHVVVNCFMFTTPRGSHANEAVHRQVADQGMHEFFLRNEKYFANLKQNVLANPAAFMDAVDPSKLGPEDRFHVNWDISKATSEVVDSDSFAREYTYAFTDPPYPLRCEKSELQTICKETMGRLFGDLSDFTIHKWSTNWSNYFEDGREWWGAFLWTLVSSDSRGWWVGASATD